jgi:hypothetical protein
MHRVTHPHQDLKVDHQQEILEIVRQDRAASQEESVNHLTGKDQAIVRIHLAHLVQKVANVGHITGKDQAIVRTRLAHHAQMVANVGLTTGKDQAIVRTHLAHHVQKVANADLTTGKDQVIVRTRLAHHVQMMVNADHTTAKVLAIVRTRLAHHVQMMVNVGLTTGKNLVIARTRLVFLVKKVVSAVHIMENLLLLGRHDKNLTEEKIRLHHTAATGEISSLDLRANQNQVLNQERKVVLLPHVKRVLEKLNFRNEKHSKVEIGMMKLLHLPHNIN